MPSEPFVSVVVPTSGRAALLAACLDTLHEQDYPRELYEVIVVENGPAAGSLVLPDGVRHVVLARPDRNGARNAGIRIARGDPICLIDDDVLLPPHWLRCVADASVRRPGAGCFGGPVLPRWEGAEPRTCGLHGPAGGTLDEGPVEREVDEVWSCNMAVQRWALDRVGLLREGLVAVDEVEWEARLVKAGGSVVYLPDAWVSHRRVASDTRVGSLVRDNFRLGYMVVALGQELPTDRVLRDLRASVAHAVRHGCTRGFTDAVRKIGSLCAIFAGRRRRPIGTSFRS
jgi:GT2 family glycosyltransferase